jgi:hypothetical protein
MVQGLLGGVGGEQGDAAHGAGLLAVPAALELEVEAAGRAAAFNFKRTTPPRRVRRSPMPSHSGMVTMPWRPVWSDRLTSSREVPIGEATPMPVMTTRWGSWGLRGGGPPWSTEMAARARRVAAAEQLAAELGQRRGVNSLVAGDGEGVADVEVVGLELELAGAEQHADGEAAGVVRWR